jgi:hypothetical protein
MRVCRYEVVGINTSGPIKKDLLEKSEIRSKRKLGEKTVKGQKALIKEARAKEVKEHKAIVDSLKDTSFGGDVLLSGLTAQELIDVTLALTGNDIKKGLKDLKNKKGILKRAEDTITEAGFVLIKCYKPNVSM